MDAANDVNLLYPDRMEPQLEGVWDGIANEKDDKALAGQVEIGEVWFASGPPTVGSVSDPQTICAGTSAVIYAYDVASLAGVSRVWAVITPPGYASGDTPVSDLPILDLSGGDGQYEGTYGGFSTVGTYNIAVVAEDTEGFISVPVQTRVTAVSGDKPPIVVTGSAGSVGKDSATLAGTVNPNGVSTDYYFEYGKLGRFGSATTAANIGNGTEAVSVSTGVTGLESGTDYQFRIVGTSSAGTTAGESRRFKTGYSTIAYVNPNDPACYNSIQEAIDAAQAGAEIRVVGGTYNEALQLNADKVLTLSGGWNEAFTEPTGGRTIIKAPKASSGSLTLQNVNIVP